MLELMCGIYVSGAAITWGFLDQDKWEHVLFWPIWLSFQFVKFLKDQWRDL